jgi:hypothetical protein
VGVKLGDTLFKEIRCGLVNLTDTTHDPGMGRFAVMEEFRFRRVKNRASRKRLNIIKKKRK